MKRLFLFLFLSLFLPACSVHITSVSATLVVVTAILAPAGTATLPPPTNVATERPPEVGSPTPPPTPVEATTISQATPALFPAAPNPEAYQWQLVADGFDHPLFLTDAGDGSSRLFVVEQGGKIRIVQNGEILPEPFLDLTGIAVDNSSERGLLGLAFHPAYASNGQFFVDYTDANGNTAIVRYTVSSDPNRADPDSAQIILQVKQPYPNHNGGDVAFGPDGYLYIGMGDGGSAGDPQGNGQRLDTLLGKLLRIDVDADPYAVPGDNPFVADTPDAKPQIWAYGLRNPWRFSFDRATHDLYIGDVGQGNWEEVNFQPANSTGGENYGWVLYEGNHDYNGGSPDGLTFPVAEYSHQEGGCSLTGGYVYRGAALPELNGVYFFGDYCTGLIWALYRSDAQTWNQTLFMSTGFNISSFGEDDTGELYVINHNGAVYRLATAP